MIPSKPLFHLLLSLRFHRRPSSSRTIPTLNRSIQFNSNDLHLRLHHPIHQVSPIWSSRAKECPAQFFDSRKRHFRSPLLSWCCYWWALYRWKDKEWQRLSTRSKFSFSFFVLHFFRLVLSMRKQWWQRLFRKSRELTSMLLFVKNSGQRIETSISPSFVVSLLPSYRSSLATTTDSHYSLFVIFVLLALYTTEGQTFTFEPTTPTTPIPTFATTGSVQNIRDCMSYFLSPSCASAGENSFLYFFFSFDHEKGFWRSFRISFLSLSFDQIWSRRMVLQSFQRLQQ